MNYDRLVLASVVIIVCLPVVHTGRFSLFLHFFRLRLFCWFSSAFSILYFLSFRLSSGTEKKTKAQLAWLASSHTLKSKIKKQSNCPRTFILRERKKKKQTQHFFSSRLHTDRQKQSNWNDEIKTAQQIRHTNRQTVSRVSIKTKRRNWFSVCERQSSHLSSLSPCVIDMCAVVCCVFDVLRKIRIWNKRTLLLGLGAWFELVLKVYI